MGKQLRHPDKGQAGGGRATGLHNLKHFGAGHFGAQYGENRPENHDGGQKRNDIIPYTGDKRILYNAVTPPHIGAVGQNKPPAGARIPRILGEGLQP